MYLQEINKKTKNNKYLYKTCTVTRNRNNNNHTVYTQNS